MKNILLIGHAACGKGTQSKLLEDRLGLHILAMGDILREHKSLGTDIGKMATELDKEGKLMPNETIFMLMKDEILKHKDSCNGFIFDGVVRTLEQAKYLDNLLDELGLPDIQIFNIEVDESTIIERAIKRGKTSGRVEDSNVEVIKKRINVFNESTVPALEYYGDTALVHYIQGDLGIEDVYNTILNKIY